MFTSRPNEVHRVLRLVNTVSTRTPCRRDVLIVIETGFCADKFLAFISLVVYLLLLLLLLGWCVRVIFSILLAQHFEGMCPGVERTVFLLEFDKFSSLRTEGRNFVWLSTPLQTLRGGQSPCEWHVVWASVLVCTNVVAAAVVALRALLMASTAINEPCRRRTASRPPYRHPSSSAVTATTTTVRHAHLPDEHVWPPKYTPITSLRMV